MSVKLIPVLMAAGFICACGGGGGTSDTTVTDTVQDTTSAEVEVEACTLTADLTDQYFHVDHLYVQEPGGQDGVLADTLTILWNTQISKDQLIIMFHVTKHDKETGELWFEAGSAVKHPSGNYQMIANPAPEVIKMELDGCRIQSTEDAVLKVYPDLVTTPIPVVKLRVDAAFTADGASINQGGTLIGGICTTDAHAINFKLVETQPGCTNFYNFVTDVGLIPNETDLVCPLGGMDGFSFKGTFDAHRISNVEAGTITVNREFSCS